MKYLFACYTDKGKRKGVNQDSLLLSHGNWRGQEVVLAVICDGMGGLDRGEMASGEVIRAFAGWFRESFPALAGQEEFEDELYESWETLFQNVHQKIKKYGKLRGIRIGTTATAMLLWQERFYVAHVGDCRIYEIKEQCRQLTKDQVQGELRRGGIDGEGERGIVEEGTHILLQGVGVSETVRPVYHSGEVDGDTVYLLCTDGFRHKVSVQELGQVFVPEELLNGEVMRRQGERITKVVMERGEKDNISVILLRAIPGQDSILNENRTREYIIDKEIVLSDSLEM